jgi:hypothetical protein
MTYWIADLLRAFALTVVVELAVAAPLLRALDPRGPRRSAGIVLANLATHPAAWFIFPGAALGVLARIARSELWAVTIELLVYRLIFSELSWRRALATSVSANALSALAGVLVTRG